MSKKIFVIAAFSVALLASAEAFADGWEIGVLKFEETGSRWAHISIKPPNCWDCTTYSPNWNRYGSKPKNVQTALKIISDDGWELVSVTASGKLTEMHFKKQN